MSAVVFDIAGGTMQNIGDIGGSEFNLTPFPVGGTISYDPVTKGVTMDGYAANACLKTNCTSNHLNVNFGLRLSFKMMSAGSIFGTYIDAGAFPFRFYIDTSNIYSNGNSTPNGGFIVVDGATINDIIFWFDLTAKTVTMTNINTGAVKTFTTDVGTVDIGSYDSVGNIYFGCANYSDSPNFPATMVLYAAALAYDVNSLLGTKYVLKKDDTYYRMNLETDTVDIVGTDIDAALSYGVDKLYDVFYPYLGEYKLIMYMNGNTAGKKLTLTRETSSGIYIDNGDGTYDTGTENVTDILTASSTMKLSTYNIDDINDTVIVVPSNTKLIVDDSIIYGTKNIADTMSGRGLIHTVDTAPVKNCKSYGHALTDTINVGKTIIPETIDDHVMKNGIVSAFYSKPQYYHTEEKTIVAIDTNEGIDKVIANDITSPLGRVSTYVLDATMFPDTYEFDLDNGLSDVTLCVGSFICIKLPEGMTDVSFPDWLTRSGNKLSGIPKVCAIYTIKSIFNNMSTNTKLNVLGAKRIH